MRETCCVFLLVWCIIPALGAGELPVNVRTTSNQCNASVAVYTDGSFIVVWSSYYSSSGRSNDIFARRFDALGQPMTDEFCVNTERDGNQTYPAVATDTQGRALIAWQGPGTDGEEDIYACIFDVNGIALTDELFVNTTTSGQQMNPNVATNGNGTFLVVWEDEQVSGRTAIVGRMLNEFGTPLSPEFPIDSGSWDCRYPDAAMNSSGNFSVVWMRDRSSNTTVCRSFDPNGVATTEPLEVNIEGISSITCPSIAMSPKGHFIIVWDGDPNRASEDQIHARLFDPNGEPTSEPFVINSDELGPHQWPQVAIDDDNEFVVVWQSESDDSDLATDIYARRFSDTGNPMEEPFLLSDSGLEKQRYPDVTMTSNGSFIAVWESDQQPGSDYDIYARVEPVLLTTDFTGDGVVDFFDFQVLGWSWKAPNEIDEISYNIPELQTFSNQWLE